MDIDGVAAIVCGGASGLGAATAAMLIAKGAQVALFDVDQERGAALARALSVSFFPVDVTNDNAIRSALADAEARNGTARILVNCAGIAPPAKVLDRDGVPLPIESFARIIDVNLVGSFNMLAQFAARLQAASTLEEERGVIINTASIAAFEGQIGQAAYAASKAAVVGMTLPIARELARHGIRVMTIAPGIFMTPMLAALPEDAQASLGKQVPFPSRLGRPEEYARLVESIITNAMLNGEVIRLDGAIRMAAK